MKFENGKHYTHDTRLNTGKRSEGFIRLSHWHNIKEREVVSALKVLTGACDIYFDITPAEARLLASQLLSHAAEVDEQHRQLEAILAQPAPPVPEIMSAA